MQELCKNWSHKKGIVKLFSSNYNYIILNMGERQCYTKIIFDLKYNLVNCPSRTITLIIRLFLVQDVRDTMCQWWLTAWEYCDRMDIRIVTVEYLVEEEEVTPIHSSQLGSQLQTDGDWLRDYRLRIIINIYLGIWDQTSPSFTSN